MDKRDLKKIIEIGFLVIIHIIILICFHELGHYIIFDTYDCDNIHFGISTDGIYTKAQCQSNEMFTLANSIHESIGYQVVPFLVVICFLLSLRLIID